MLPPVSLGIALPLALGVLSDVFVRRIRLARFSSLSPFVSVRTT